jgi:hypothetical protein
MDGLSQQDVSEWPGVAADAGAWWAEPVAANETAATGVYRHPEDVPAVEAELPSSQWPEVAAAADAWWDECTGVHRAESVLRYADASRLADVARESSAEWPGVAAAAGAWWDAPLASGPYSADVALDDARSCAA